MSLYYCSLHVTGAQKGHPLQSIYHFDDFYSILPFWDFHSINARIITHMRKFITRTQCARHNEYVHKHDEYDVCIYIYIYVTFVYTYYLPITYVY